MAHIINTRVKSGNTLVLSGSTVELTGAVNSVNNITAPSFIGSLTGNASTVTNGVYTTNIASNATTGVTAGNGLTGGGTVGTLTLDVGAGTGISVAADAVSIDTAVVPRLGVANTFTGVITASAGITGSDAKFTSITGALNGSITGNAATVTNGVYTTTIATVATTGVTAGAGLTGGGTVGVLTVDVGAGTGITVNANDVAVDATYVATLGTSQTFAGAKIFTSTVTFSGGVYVTASNVAAAYSVNSGDYVVFATGGPYTITVPSATTNRGRQLIFKKAESSETAITLSASAGNIDGGTFDLNGPYQSVTLVSNGTNWFIM